MKRKVLTYEEYWGYYWRITSRHAIPGIFQWDHDIVELIEKRCELRPGATILDLGCGGGDQAKVFARKGYKVTGIDKVPSLIDYARKLFKGEGLKGEFIVQDMRSVAYNNEFDLCTMLSGTFGLLTERENAKLLVKIHSALKAGGQAFIDYLPIELYSSTRHTRTWHPIENGYALSEEWFDVPTSTYRTRIMHILLDGTILEAADEAGYGANEVIRCYSAKEIELLAESAGFTVTAHLSRKSIGNPDYIPEENEPRRMLILKKAG